jgi:hypothetical protein
MAGLGTVGEMRHRLLGVALAIAAIVAVPATASAHRPASRRAKAAMIYDPSGRYWGNAPVAEPRSIPRRCFVADIATVVKGSRWGAWSFSSYALHHQGRCHPGNGYVVEHKIGRRWYVYWEGSDLYPPTHGRYGARGVPRAIAKDLKAGLGKYA